MADPTNLPAKVADAALPAEVDDMTSLKRSPSLALRIWFDDNLYDRCKNIARHMANANGFTPRHLLGQAEACFAVVTRALTWKLDPHAVAMSTYQTPGGSIGFEGKLIQAILENSGRLVGGVKFTHYGDWNQVKGKFQLRRNDKGREAAVRTWTIEDARGLGVTVSAQVKGEVEPRTMNFDLDTAWPLNSTLWATRPHQQICYTAVRAFASLCAPGLLMGVPFDDDGMDMLDVTPVRHDATIPSAPSRAQFQPQIIQDGDDGDGSVIDPETGEVSQGGGGAVDGGQPSLGLGDGGPGKPVNYFIPVPMREGADKKKVHDWMGWAELVKAALPGLASRAEVDLFREKNRPTVEALFRADPGLASDVVADIAEREDALN